MQVKLTKALQLNAKTTAVTTIEKTKLIAVVQKCTTKR